MKKLLILGTLCLLFAISVVGQSQKEWEKVQSLNSWNVYQQFILNYPDGKYTDEAKKKQSLLEKPAEVIKVEENKVSTELPAENSINSALGDPSKNTSPIVIKKRRYYVNDIQLKPKEVKSLLKSDPESAIVYKKAMTYQTVGVVFLGVALGFTFYAMAHPPREEGPLPGISEEEMRRAMKPLYYSMGFIAVSLPFLYAGNMQLKKSVSIYNSKRTTGYNNYQKLELGITQNGLRMIYRF